MKLYQCSFHVGPTRTTAVAAEIPGAEPGTDRVYLVVPAHDATDARLTLQDVVASRIGGSSVPLSWEISIRPARVRS
jgi:hypothetical protein